MSEGNERDSSKKGQSEGIQADQKTVRCELERQVWTTEFDNQLGPNGGDSKEHWNECVRGKYDQRHRQQECFGHAEI